MVGVDAKLLALVACEILKPAIGYVWDGENRPRHALEALEGWALGTVQREELDLLHEDYDKIDYYHASASLAATSTIDAVYLALKVDNGFGASNAAKITEKFISGAKVNNLTTVRRMVLMSDIYWALVTR